MPRPPLTLEQSTSKMYARLAAEAAANAKTAKAKLMPECAKLYTEVTESISKINISEVIKKQGGDVKKLTELRDQLSGMLRYLQNLAK